MNGNNGGSTVAQSQNSGISAEAAQRVMRLAEARQHSEDVRAPIPDETSVSADVQSFFDEDGMLVSAETAQDIEVGGELVVDDYEAFLADVAPERLERIDENFGSLPGTREDLVKYHAEKVISAAEERGEALHVESGGGELFELTIHQQKRPEQVSEVLRRLEEESDEDEAGFDLEECPKCGAEHVTADTVEMQTRAADESGTQLTKTSCGCTFRRND